MMNIHYNRFCYICGEVTLSRRKDNITSLVKTYFSYFGKKLGNQDK